jgi:HPr kinase/phosphorylase
MYLVKDFYERHGKALGLEMVAGRKGLHRRIQKPEVHRPGLGLAGFLKHFSRTRLLIFGKNEIDYLSQLQPDTRDERLSSILTQSTPAVIIAARRVPSSLISVCETKNIPLFVANFSATRMLSQVAFVLLEDFSPAITLHGTLVELFGVGVLIQGESSVGKSEAALGLIERGHRLISDDVVRIKKKEGGLVGSGPELTRHLMEIRGIGIINVAHLYGAVCVRTDKQLDLVIQLEEWNDGHFYDRVGLEEKFVDILGIKIPHHILPVKPGRDVVLLVETVALNYRLKEMGYHSAREFNAKLLETIAQKSKRKVAVKKE